MTVELDGWLTSVRLRRLPDALSAIRSYPPPGVPVQRVNRIVWNRCAGPLGDVEELIQVLLGAGLIEQHGSLTRLTTRGRLIATQDHQQAGRLLARSLIDAGYFRNQTRRLLASSEFTAGGDLICKRSDAVGVAAQLSGILRRWREVVLDSHLRIPVALVEELLATWALQPVPRSIDEEGRKQVGDRAEAYSYRLEQETADDPSRIQWVALDDDSLGYDISNATTTPARCIEVKGSQGHEVRFFLSSNEWRVGHGLGDAYELHFWGCINLTRPRPEEYRALKAQGYPLVFRNIEKALKSGNLRAIPSQYLINGNWHLSL